MPQIFAPLLVADSSDIAIGVRRLVLKHPEGETLPAWDAGAHLTVRLPNLLERQYSLCGDPADRHYEIAVRQERWSRGGSDYIHRYLAAGQVIEAAAPENHFALEGASSYRLIAAGIGITAILPMARELHRRGADLRTLYLGRTRDRMAYVDEVAAIPGALVITRARRTASTLADFVTGWDSGTTVYECGPARLIDDLQALAPSHPMALRVERFSLDELIEWAGDPFVAHCRRSGSDVQVDADESFLTALRGAGLDAAGSCEQGICGTCAVPLVSGEVDHRDYVVPAGHAMRANVVYPCVSRGIGTIEIDL